MAALAVSFAFCMGLDMVYGRLFRKDLPVGLGDWAWWFIPDCVSVAVLATDVSRGFRSIARPKAGCLIQAIFFPLSSPERQGPRHRRCVPRCGLS